jgi:hypothetical protein
MRIFFTLSIIFCISFGCCAQSSDTAEIIHKSLIGTWIDVDEPGHQWAITKDTIRTEVTCWVKYTISKERHPGPFVPGVYWFGLSYQYCGENWRIKIENISLDGTYMKFHDLDNGVTYQFKRKQ